MGVFPADPTKLFCLCFIFMDEYIKPKEDLGRIRQTVLIIFISIIQIWLCNLFYIHVMIIFPFIYDHQALICDWKWLYILTSIISSLYHDEGQIATFIVQTDHFWEQQTVGLSCYFAKHRAHIGLHGRRTTKMSPLYELRGVWLVTLMIRTKPRDIFLVRLSVMLMNRSAVSSVVWQSGCPVKSSRRCANDPFELVSM